MSPKRALVFVLFLAAALTAFFLLSSDPAPADVDPGDSAAGTGTGATGAAGDTQKGDVEGAGGENRKAVTGAAGKTTDPIGPAERTVGLRGRLVNRAGAGVARKLSYRDNFFSPGGLPLPIEAQREIEPIETESDVEGRFEFRIQPSRKGILRLDGKEFVFAKANAGRGYRVGVEATDLDLGDLLVVPAAALSGQVVAGGSGVQDVAVVANLHRVTALGGFYNERVKTDAQGRFTIKGLVPGKVRLATESPEFLPAEQVIELASGERKEDVLIKLQQGGVITGTVVDDRGQPVEGARVTASRAKKLGPSIEYSGYQRGEATTTDASGHFRLAGLASKAVDILATKQGLASGRVRQAAAGTPNLSVTMQRLGTVTGVLVDEKGTPIAGSVVAAAPEGRGIGFRGSFTPHKTDAEGKFVIDDAVPGENEISATGKEHVDAVETVTVRPGEMTKDVRLVARRGATLTVTVLDEKKQPVPDAKVTVMSEGDDGGNFHIRANPGGARRAIRREVRRERRNGNDVTRVLGGAEELGSATSDANGVAVIRGLEAGKVEVSARHATLALLDKAKADVPDGGAAAAQLSMLRGGFAEVAIVDTNGNPIGNRNVVVKGPLVGAEDAASDSHKAGEDGTVRVGPLRPGRYAALLEEDPKVRSISAGMSFSMLGDQKELADSKAPFEIAPDRATEVRVVMPVLTKVVGVVRDAEGVVEGAEVELIAEGGIRMPMMGKHKTQTDGEGRFELAGMPSGKYTLYYHRSDAVVPAEKVVVLVKNQPMHEEALVLPGAVVQLHVQDASEGFGVEEAKIGLAPYREPTAGAPAQPRRRQVVMIGLRTSGGPGSGGPSTFKMTSGANSIQTDAKGNAEITGVPAGKYTLTIEHTEYAKVSKVIQVAANQLKKLGSIRVAPGCKLRGKIDLGKAAAGAINMCTVQLRTLADVVVDRKISQGTFRFAGVAPGRYKVRAQAVGSEQWGPEQTVELNTDRAARVTLALPAAK